MLGLAGTARLPRAGRTIYVPLGLLLGLTLAVPLAGCSGGSASSGSATSGSATSGSATSGSVSSGAVSSGAGAGLPSPARPSRPPSATPVPAPTLGGIAGLRREAASARTVEDTGALIEQNRQVVNAVTTQGLVGAGGRADVVVLSLVPRFAVSDLFRGQFVAAAVAAYGAADGRSANATVAGRTVLLRSGSPVVAGWYADGKAFVVRSDDRSVVQAVVAGLGRP